MEVCSLQAVVAAKASASIASNEKKQSGKISITGAATFTEKIGLVQTKCA